MGEYSSSVTSLVVINVIIYLNPCVLFFPSHCWESSDSEEPQEIKNTVSAAIKSYIPFKIKIKNIYQAIMTQWQLIIIQDNQTLCFKTPALRIGWGWWWWWLLLFCILHNYLSLLQIDF